MSDHIFSIACNPPKTTHQASLKILRPKGRSKPIIAKGNASSKGRAAETMLFVIFLENRPKQTFKEPVRVVIDWVYPWRKSEPKKNRELGKIPCTTRPDVDNLLKFVLDCMTKARWWDDDSLVTEVTFRKFWGDEPGISGEVEIIQPTK